MHEKYIILLVILSAAVICDIRTYKIPNLLIGAGLIAGLAVQIMWLGVRWGTFCFIRGAFVPVVIFFILFIFKMLGTGDIKLMAVVGGFVGPGHIVKCSIYIIVFAALISLVKVYRNKNLKSRLQYLAEYFNKCLRTRTIEPYILEESDDSYCIHFSIGILLGTLFCVGGFYY